MTAAQIKADVDRGLELYLLIDKYQEELKAINGRLETAALEGDQIALEDSEREGTQFLAEGSEFTVPVVIESDMIVGSFEDRGATHLGIVPAAGEFFASFFQPTTTWRNVTRSGKQFRARAAELLGTDAPAFVSACLNRNRNGIPKNRIKVDWDRASK